MRFGISRSSARRWRRRGDRRPNTRSSTAGCAAPGRSLLDPLEMAPRILLTRAPEISGEAPSGPCFVRFISLLGGTLRHNLLLGHDSNRGAQRTPELLGNSYSHIAALNP